MVSEKLISPDTLQGIADIAALMEAHSLLEVEVCGMKITRPITPKFEPLEPMKAPTPEELKKIEDDLIFYSART